MSSNKAKKAIAIFDLDRTITRGGTFTPFLLTSRSSLLARVTLFTAMLPAMIAYKFSDMSRTTLKNKMLAATFEGCPADEIDALAARFAAKRISTELYSEAVSAIEHHRDQGATLILATAAIDLYAQRFADALGFHYLVATRTTAGAIDNGPPQVIGENCFGEHKRIAIEKLMREEIGVPLEEAKVTFYTDHYSDAALLRKIEHQVVVNPRAKMRALAKAMNMPIEYWTTSYQGVAAEAPAPAASRS